MALRKTRLLLDAPWAPDQLAVGSHANYLWCAKGIIESGLMKAFSRATSDEMITRNWATVLKLQALTREDRERRSEHGISGS